MPIEALTSKDLELLHELRPPDWNPLAPVFDFYLRVDFCFPIKYTEHGAIAGIGATIIHQHTAWLAHIIVHNDHRNKGIGGIITKALIDQANKPGIQTVLLLATSLGEPVYRRHGFIKEMDYLFFKTEQDTSFNNGYTISSFEERFTHNLLQLDRDVSGEDRSKLIAPLLKDAKLIVEQNAVQGYYLPTLGDGPVLARNKEAGSALLYFKHTQGIKKAALPEANQHGIEALTSLGLKEYLKGSRMYLGKPLPWQPAKVYNRIGGNFG
ncbi:GNAT family N-acetyltransferase [Ohtaekwangia kribbensis]|jgi:N-acetylglutamate synthase-like GNAT family acetyltransferase|uniref:GNAT family N-acetyltransferase n=1 Tax=Ohtaekwangia kribbensis TaxID=688913 RepID=A0ABW3K3U2_9BACT